MRKSLENSRMFPVLGLCLLAFLIKLHFLWFVHKDPVFAMPVVDSLEFDLWGYQIAQGKLLWDHITNHPPLYAYFLGFIYELFGYSPFKAAVIQNVMASAGLFLLFRIAQRYFNTLTAYLSVILAGTYWFFIYVSTFLFSENLSIFLNIVLVYILTFRKDRPVKYLSAGCVLALTEICRPQMMPFGIAFLFLLWTKDIPRPEKFKFSALFLIPVLVLSFFVMAQNHRVSGQWVLRTQIGANVYMGNDPAFHGTNLHVKIGREWDKFISAPHQHYQRDVTEAESNQYFMDKTWSVIRERPVEWAGLIGSKIFAVLTGLDFLRTEDVYVYDLYFTDTPYFLVSTKLIFILALMGLFFSLQSRRNAGLLYLALIGFVPMFFFPIKTRYLMGFVPFVIVFAGYALAHLYELFQSKQYPQLWKCLVAAGGLAAVSLWNPLGFIRPDVAETVYAIAKNYDGRKNEVMAEKYYLAAIQVDPAHISAYNDLGVLYMNQNKCGRAVPYFESAVRLDPEAVYPKKNLDLCRKTAGQ
ncbi:MAG: glycosyltransferase family 39 protein [Candidatus Omnitrophica bacterium]|nr:glycosyltransferase family 39 protein [Candidatus Omnitrophota bacterium]